MDEDETWEVRWRRGIEDRMTDLEKKVDALDAFKSFVVGGATLVAFLLGIGARTLAKWVGQ